MGGRIFWDVDTQVDFMRSYGKLYVTGAESIEGNLARLTEFARNSATRILGSVDYHDPSDPEISDHPDFLITYPSHCLRGTEGQAKVAATAPRDPLWIDSQPVGHQPLLEQVRAHTGEVIFRKQQFDVFTNPNVDPVIAELDPDEVVVYGVALDVCNRHAVEGFLARGRNVTLVVDATRAIAPERGAWFVADWQGRGVRIAETSTILAEP